jgi:hypothetical protein
MGAIPSEPWRRGASDQVSYNEESDRRGFAEFDGPLASFRAQRQHGRKGRLREEKKMIELEREKD